MFYEILIWNVKNKIVIILAFCLIKSNLSSNSIIIFINWIAVRMLKNQKLDVMKCIIWFKHELMAKVCVHLYKEDINP